MAKKKDESVLGLPPLLSPAPSFSGTMLASYTSDQSLTPRQVEILENLHEDELIIGVFHQKSRLGLEKMNELKCLAVSDVWFTFQHIEETRLEAQGTGCQAAMDEFCRYMTTLSARHTLGVVEVGANRIAELVGESVLPLPPPPAPPPQKGFWTRLFGE